MIDNLDAILDDSEKHGTFHDATLVRLQRRNDHAIFDFTLCVGNPNAASLTERELRRPGVLTIHGIRSWQVDPPDVSQSDMGSWLTSDGPLTAVDSDAARRFMTAQTPELVTLYMYFNDSNAFLFLACERLEFGWC